MARFQALTNNVLETELEMLRTRLGLQRSQKAELLREIAALAAWIVRQAEQGRQIEGRRGKQAEPLVHPALERLRSRKAKDIGERLTLSDEEAARLAEVMNRGYRPPPALRKALANLASPKRRPPKLRWKKSAA